MRKNCRMIRVRRFVGKRKTEITVVIHAGPGGGVC